MVEQIQALADDFEFHIYSSRVEDIDLEKSTWHRIPAIPGPLLVGFIWFFLANHVARWFERTFRHGRSDLVCSPGINCFDADLVVVHMLFAEFLERTKKDRHFSSHPFRFWFRLLHRRLYYRLIVFLEKRIYPRPELPLVAVSRKLSAALARRYRRSQAVSVVYPGIDAEKFSPSVRERLRAGARRQMSYSEKDFVVLLVGNDWVNKGLACLLAAAALVANPSMKIAVVGTDEPSPFRARLSLTGQASRVQFFPLRPDPEFYYAAADLYAGPSLEDAFALPPLEAMACGVPAIVSGRAGISELVTHGEDGYILEDPQRPQELAALIARLEGDSALRERIGGRAALTARRYTWERNAGEFRQVLLAALVGTRAIGSAEPVETRGQGARD